MNKGGWSSSDWPRQVMSNPQHDYTRLLLDSIPTTTKKWRTPKPAKRPSPAPDPIHVTVDERGRPVSATVQHSSTQWGLFELVLERTCHLAIPSATSSLTATFESDCQSMLVTGFYDGEGVYRVRFMPENDRPLDLSNP